ncbi:MAG: peptidoglycan-binding protein [Ruminococcus sp.]|nr:peptidoglycan-binding protein [Ruminococcus sp.]
MSKNYLTYPFKVMRITQNYNGTTSHKPHTTGNIVDYPIDEGGKDAGRDPIYARCKLTVKRIYGVGTKGTNTIWLESAEKVELANGKTDYITLMLTHPNDSDLKKIKVGQTFDKGDVICSEGTDGATGNHIHMAVGMGKYKGNGWVQNSNGKWVLTSENGAVKPEEAFFIDPNFTTVKDSKGLKFKQLPKDEPKKTATKKPAASTNKTGSFLPARGYFKKGDVSANVGKVATFMRKTFPSYTSEKALGNIYGDNLIAAITEFQKRKGLKADGCLGALTLTELTKHGFKW